MTWLSGLSAPRHRQALFCKTPSAGCRKVKIQAACPVGAQPRGKANNANLHVTGKREGDLAREKVPCAGPEQGCCRCRVSFVDEAGSSCWVPLGGSFTLSHSVSAVWPAEHRACHHRANFTWFPIRRALCRVWNLIPHLTPGLVKQIQRGRSHLETAQRPHGSWASAGRTVDPRGME